MKTRMLAIVADLGGVENCSQVELALIERFGHVEGLLLQREHKMRMGEAIDVAEYLSLVDRAVKIGNTLGLKRRARPVPTLEEVLASPMRRADSEEADK